MLSKRQTRSWEDSAPVFAALGEETRIRLVARLSQEGSLSITRLTEGTEVSRQAITKHLNVLADAGLVRGVRMGRETVWELEPKRLTDARRLLDAIAGEWDERIGRLRELVETEE